MCEPWVAIGDFNNILANAPIGGSQSSPSRMRWFNEQFLNYGLSDLGFQGLCFTWKGPMTNGFNRLFECLEHAFGNN